MSIDFPV